MMSFLFWAGLFWAGSPAFGADAVAAQPPRTVAELRCFSGRYPHLAVFNDNAECGIGAVVPWAGKLWVVTYAPHAPHGGDDKLYEIDPRLRIEARPESIGGTPANRLIHRESNQLFIGPYCIDADGNVRVIPYTKALGRPTATARHLCDPANKVYTFTMEEGLYEIDVHSLEVKTIHKDMHAEGAVDYLPGYHGKGGYTGQRRLVVANNGYKGEDRDVSFYDFAGCLAEWDARQWKVLEENQYCEVTGPGGIYGNSRDTDPVWATGWDMRSVLLRVLDDGTWRVYRLPIADYSYVARHGWHTEWPRIRRVVPGDGGRPPQAIDEHARRLVRLSTDVPCRQYGGLAADRFTFEDHRGLHRLERPHRLRVRRYGSIRLHPRFIRYAQPAQRAIAVQPLVHHLGGAARGGTADGMGRPVAAR